MSVHAITTLSEEQRARRSAHVGASEVAALFDLHPFLTRFELWHKKAGNLPEVDLSDNDRVFWGTVLEPAIAVGIAEKTGWSLSKFEAYCPHPTVAGMGCSPDYKVDGSERGPGLVQIKNIDGLVFRDWEDKKPPIYYELQLQHELACSQFTWGALGVLVGGNDLRVFDYGRHESAIARIEREVAAFWETVRAGEEPKPDFETDLDTLQVLHGYAQPGSVVDLAADLHLDELCQAYKAAGADEKAACERKDAAKAEILTLIGEAELAFSNSFRVNAKNIAGGPVSYVRKPYRDFRIYARKGAKED